MKLFLRLAIVLFPMLLCSCSTFQGLLNRTQFTSEVVYHEHIVTHPGETLASISAWYTGKSQNWKMIQSHNPYLNIHNIRLGDRIRIPSHTLKRQQQMPKTYVTRWNGGIKKTPMIINSKPAMNNFPPTHQASTPNTKPVSYQYNVQSISGCEAYANTALGLDLCARHMNGEFKKVVPAPNKNEYY